MYLSGIIDLIGLESKKKVFLILGIVFFINTGWGDKVYLKDGRIIEGSITYMTKEYIDIVIANIILASFEVDKIDSINMKEIDNPGNIKNEPQHPNNERDISNVTDIPFSREIRPHTLYGGVGAPFYFMLGYKMQIFPYLSLGLRGGGLLIFVMDVGSEIKCYLSPNSNSSLTIGIHYDIMVPGDVGPSYILTSFTIGDDYLSPGGINFFLDIGPALKYNIKKRDYDGWWPYLTLGLGFAFDLWDYDLFK